MWLVREHENIKIASIIMSRMLATQSIEARARQEGCRQACTIGLSINEDTKLEKRKRKDKQPRKELYTLPSHVRVTWAQRLP